MGRTGEICFFYSSGMDGWVDGGLGILATYYLHIALREGGGLGRLFGGYWLWMGWDGVGLEFLYLGLIGTFMHMRDLYKGCS